MTRDDSHAAHCAATVDGSACTEPVTATAPVPLCTRHRVEIALAIVPDVLSSAIEDGRGPRRLSEADRRLVDEAQRVEPVLSGHHPSCVYFVSSGIRVKIGITTNLGKRLVSLTMQPSDILVLLRGDRRLEAALHHYFADFRIGHTEWFQRIRTIDEFIQGKRRTPAYPLKRPKERTPVPRASTRHDIDMSAEDLLHAVRRHIGPNARAAHLSTILAGLQAEGAPANWSTSDLRTAYARAGIPVRRAVRVGARTSTGIHRDDLPPVQEGQP